MKIHQKKSQKDNYKFVFNHDNFNPQSIDQQPMSGIEMLERINRMQMATGKELNNYDSVVQIKNFDTKLGVPKLLAQKHSPEAFYNSGWSRAYEQRFGQQETGQFFKQPEAILQHEGIYSIAARRSAIDTQFQITKEALDRRQNDNEQLYLGTEEQKALQSIVEKQLSKEAGGFITIAEYIKTAFTSKDGRTRRRNERLAQKIAKEMHLPESKTTAIVESITGHMASKSDEVARIESSAAAGSGLGVEAFRKTNRGKKLTAELMHFLVVGGIVGTGIAMGALAPLTAIAAIPLLGINIKGRVPIGLDGDSVISGLRDGRNLTETIENTARELDSTLHMTQNLINSSEILARGRHVRYLHGVDQRYDNLKRMIEHKQMQFDVSSLGDQSLETKSMYETLGVVIDAQGQIQLNEAKKFKKMLFNVGERVFGDHKANQAYKRSIKVMKDELPDKASLTDIIALNQKKVLELDHIVRLATAEITEESGKRKYEKHPEKLEGKRSMLRQLQRFAKTQRYFVNDQKTFYLLKELGNKPDNSQESRKQALYEAAVISFLGSFDSADQLLSRFGSNLHILHQDGRNFTPNRDQIRDTLTAYYEGANPKKILAEMTCSMDFETFFMQVGSFTSVYGSHKQLPSMAACNSHGKAIDQRRICDYKDYNFDNDFVVSPKGTKFYMPLGIPLGVLEKTAIGAGAQAVKNSMAGVEASAQMPQAVLDAIIAANAPKAFMADFWAPTLIPAGYAPNIAGSIAGGVASAIPRHNK